MGKLLSIFLAMILTTGLLTLPSEPSAMPYITDMGKNLVFYAQPDEDEEEWEYEPEEH